MPPNSITNKIKFCLICSITILLIGCASHKKVNKLASELNCKKPIHFAFDKESKFAKVEYKGASGDTPYPDYIKSFKESVEELERDSNMKLLYKDALGFPSDSIIQVIVKIESIVWGVGNFAALMEVELSYKMPDRELNIIGNNKVFMSATKKGNIYKCLKHGNYVFLSIVCDE